MKIQGKPQARKCIYLRCAKHNNNNHKKSVTILQTDSHSTQESEDEGKWNVETRVQNTILEKIQRPITGLKHIGKLIQNMGKKLIKSIHNTDKKLPKVDERISRRQNSARN